MDTFIQLIAVALCSTAISFTITVTSIFEWFREGVSSLGIHKLEELVFCPWCFSHYVTFTILFTSDVEMLHVSKHNVYNSLFTWFVIQGMIGMFHYVILRTYEPIGKAMLIRKMDKIREQKQQQNL